MAGKDNNIPELYQVKDWDLHAAELEYADKDGKAGLSKKEQRKVRRAHKRNYFDTQEKNFNMNQNALLYDSFLRFRDAVFTNQAGKSPTPVVKPPVVKPAVEEVVPVMNKEEKGNGQGVINTEGVVDAGHRPVETDWLQLAKDNQFTSLGDVKAFQKKVGLPETGELDEESLKKLEWYRAMQKLGYTEDVSVNGVVNFTNNLGHTYFADGTTYTAQGKTNYDYKTLSPNSELVAHQTTAPIKPFLATEEQFRNSKYFRKHALGRQYIEIDGKKYPMMVTQNIEENHPLGLKNDMSYAFDPTTGKVRLLSETAAGLVHNKMFDKNSTWIDISPFLKQEIDNQNNLQIEWDTWLQENPSPSYSLSDDYRRTYQQWQRAYNAKKAELEQKGLVLKKQGGLIKKQIKLNTKFNKQGGTMNRTKYFQQGGAAPQQDMQQQIIQLVQAAMQGDQKATETINQIMQAAQQGDQQAAQIAQMIQQVAQQMQGQATAAKWGAKLGYLRSLKYAKGGKTCPTCNQEIEMKKCGGKKAKKRYFGGWL